MHHAHTANISETDEPIYLDFNATTPVDKAVAQEMRPFLEDFFGNPSSSHAYGVRTKKAVELARKRVSEMLGCQPDEIIFTSGGSESNNYAIKGYAFGHRDQGNHIITSQIEHPATAEVCKYLETKGFKVTYLPVDSYGVVDLKALEDAITPQTILISIMHSNNEVGTLQPIAEIAQIAKRKSGSHRIAIHTDAAQSVGKVPLNVNDLSVDLLSIACHKFYAPKGIGLLFIRRGTQLEKLIHGAPHELNKRAGTENILHIVGVGKAAELVSKNLSQYAKHMQAMRDRLHDRLSKAIPRMKVCIHHIMTTVITFSDDLNGHPELRLPNTLSVSFWKVEANTLLAQISDRVAASAGAACHSDSVEVSAVLTAMKVPLE